MSRQATGVYVYEAPRPRHGDTLGGALTCTHRHTCAKEGTQGPSFDSGILGIGRTLPETREGERTPGMRVRAMADTAKCQLSGL